MLGRGIVAYDALFNPTLNVRKIPSQIRSHVMQFVALPLINLFISPHISKRAGQDSQQSNDQQKDPKFVFLILTTKYNETLYQRTHYFTTHSFHAFFQRVIFSKEWKYFQLTQKSWEWSLTCPSRAWAVLPSIKCKYRNLHDSLNESPIIIPTRPICFHIDVWDAVCNLPRQALVRYSDF